MGKGLRPRGLPGQQAGRVAPKEQRLGFRVEAALPDLGQDSFRPQQGVVRGEEQPLGAQQRRRQGEDPAVVEERRSRRVEVRPRQGLIDLRHQRVEGEAATPVGADDGVAREVLDEAQQHLRCCPPLAGVEVPHRLRGVDQDGKPQALCQLHGGGKEGGVVQAEALGVRVELPHASQAPAGAPLDLGQGVVAQAGLTPQKPTSRPG